MAVNQERFAKECRLTIDDAVAHYGLGPEQGEQMYAEAIRYVHSDLGRWVIRATFTYDGQIAYEERHAPDGAGMARYLPAPVGPQGAAPAPEGPEQYHEGGEEESGSPAPPSEATGEQEGSDGQENSDRQRPRRTRRPGGA